MADTGLVRSGQMIVRRIWTERRRKPLIHTNLPSEEEAGMQ